MSKGVSEIVTTILLIAIVAAVGTGVLLFSMGYFSTATSARQQILNQDIATLQEHFLIADAMLTNQSSVNASVYNYGDISVTIAGFYVDGSPFTIKNGPTIAIPPHQSGWVNSTAIFNSTKLNVAFSIKIVSSLGNSYQAYFVMANATH